MKAAIIYILLAGSMLFCACKKNRTCECKNANGTYVAGELEATKSQAKKHCKSLSTTTTECYVK